MLRKEAVSGEVLELIFRLMGKDYLKDFFLVGGTGLALRIGHRKSDDIDLFTQRDFDQKRMLEYLDQDFDFQMDAIDKNTIKGSVEGIKVDLLSHKYPLLKPLVEEGGVVISSLEDLSAMKLNAISNDGTRSKDFIDIYFLLKDHDVAWILDNYKEKYSLRNPMHALKSLGYFDEVDTNEWPELIMDRELTWRKVSRNIDAACREYTRKIGGKG
jgi:hypothetical protein